MVRTYREEFRLDPRPDTIGDVEDVAGVRRDGTEFPMEMVLGPIQTPEGLVITATVRNVAERREWPLSAVLSELAAGYLEAGPVIGRAGGRLDAIALGEWIHGGDVRAAWGEPLAYASDGFDDACALLIEWTRGCGVPSVEVSLPGGTLWLGVSQPGRPHATLVTGGAALMRMFAGRPVEPSEYQLTGATDEELVVF